jgi:hypothetical protein
MSKEQYLKINCGYVGNCTKFKPIRAFKMAYYKLAKKLF